MSFLRSLHRCRRNAAAAVASASFLLLVLVLSVSLATRRDPNDDAGVFITSSSSSSPSSGDQEQGSCQELQLLEDHGARCRYLRSHPPCGPQGYVDYLRLFYCSFGRRPWLGHAVLVLWLLVLFYLLGDTASEYFCASLEGLSAALRLPPAIAGVTLLSLGNGAPDVLSSIVATIERRGFVRDVCFLLVALCYLLAVLLTGTITVWAAASFLSLYAAYVLLVWTSHCCAAAELDNKQPPSDLAAPLLLDDAPPALPVSSNSKPTSPRTFSRSLLDALQSPLYLPRRLTIPDIATHRWSRPYAVSSALLSPLLLAFISSPTSPLVHLAGILSPLLLAFISSPTSPLVHLAGTLSGVLLAIAAAQATDASAPPHGRWARLPWLAGGFLMSVLWSYLLARELVALLVAVGVVVGVKASVLGVTVLAWGNSLGDLVSDVALAMHGGAQTAVSGCYAGPAFNTVVGLGLSLTLAAGGHYPEPYAIPVDASVYVTMGFLAAALVWALMVLPMRGMRLDRVLGVGLLLIYLCFLCIRVSQSIGVLSLHPRPRIN